MEIFSKIPIEVIIYLMTGATVILSVVGIVRSHPVLKDIVHKILKDTIGIAIPDNLVLQQVVSNFIRYVEEKLENSSKPLKGKVWFRSILNGKLLNKILTIYVSKVVVPSLRKKNAKKNNNK